MNYYGNAKGPSASLTLDPKETRAVRVMVLRSEWALLHSQKKRDRVGWRERERVCVVNPYAGQVCPLASLPLHWHSSFLLIVMSEIMSSTTSVCSCPVPRERKREEKSVVREGRWQMANHISASAWLACLFRFCPPWGVGAQNLEKARIAYASLPLPPTKERTRRTETAPVARSGERSE